MNAINIVILGKFDIIVHGNSALTYLGNSSKSILLLKYLILNKGKPVSIYDLIDVFWSENEKSINPESALKTMVSRIRSSLAKASPLLKDCILCEGKSYSWNPSIECDVDVFIFEDLCNTLQNETVFDENVREKYLLILNLYGGDLSYSTANEDWLVSRSLYLHHLYLQAVYRFIGFLKEIEEFETIIHVCRIALDIDTFDEQLNLALMNAHKVVGHNNAALMQYRHITSAYYKYLGVEPSEKMLDFYKDLIKADLATETDINSIRQDLKKVQESDGGAFTCDYSIFKDIYQLQLRNMERQKSRMFLSLLSISQSMDAPLEPLVLDGIMRELLEILKECLRKGDTIARYSSSQYALLLPMINYTNGHIVINRIKTMFYQKYQDNAIKLNFQFSSIDPD